ncbi:DNA-binding MarR family transcriptional regulator [Mucilaginibacter frigoritolerans]|uniref:DNA-binding MarR family transcriptional regulator n=1 Tax=Mucilaginibacter frigoritolerans TaxID=652788 RepID=A0A562UCY4_9SPHI|nr:MarR family transcriptional regulator [Mucilaginibacter frigoritolerans]TWJ03187.1 DNA-binding MarR family transcriptional regulator [Mucilaginibacter frigoritolerans]
MNHKAEYPTPPSLIAQIGSFYHTVYRECDKIFQGHFFPLQMDQVPVLLMLYYSRGASQKDIVISLGRDKASINRTISVLLKKDIVKVTTDTIDKRKTYVELTASGEKLAMQADAIIGRFDAVLSSELTEHERKEFDKTMLKLIEIVTPC